MKLSNFFETVHEGAKRAVNSKHSQTITGALAVGGMILTAVMAYRMRPKVDAIISEQKKRIDALDEMDTPEEEKAAVRKEITKETIMKLAPVAGPTIASATATAGLMVGSVVISNGKINKLASAVSMSEVMYKELFDKTKEVVGEEKANEIQTKLAEDKIKEVIKSEEDLEALGIIQARGGNQLFYDLMTGRVFRSDVDTIYEACNYLNRKICSGKEPYITYNEFYSELDMSQVGFGDDRGWGGHSLTNVLEPNMNNATVIGKTSVIILDWYTKPSMNFK